MVSDEVQDQTSGRTAGEATTRNLSASPGIIVAVAGMMSTRRTGGAAGVNSRALSGAQLAAASELSQKSTRVEVRYNGIAIGLTTGVVLRRFQIDAAAGARTSRIRATSPVARGRLH